MKYLSGKTGGYDSYEYAKSILPKIGELQEFSAFYSDTNPYYEDLGIDRVYYNFIVKDDCENEIWFDTNCGYGGVGPNCTEKILQLFGARDNYNVGKDKAINKKDVVLNHDINLLVVKHNKYKATNKTRVLFLKEIKPYKAATRYAIIEALKSIGTLRLYDYKNSEFEEYFKRFDFKDNSVGEYKVDNILYLSSHLNEVSDENIEKFINTIIFKNGGEAIIQKTL